MSAKKILVVEDDETIRELTRQILELKGYVVDCAENGETGLQYLRNTKVLPDLILLDLMMPIKDGHQFCMEQFQDPRLAAIPVVIMSAADDIERTQAKLGVKGFLKKPSDLDVILQTVKAHCR